MDRPRFLAVAMSSFLLDMLFLVTLPVLGYASILGIVLVVPMVLAGGAADALRWLRSRQSETCPWSALSSGLCAMSLIYLVLAVVVTRWNPEGGDIWTIVIYLYFLLLTLRLHGAALCGCLLSPVCLFLGHGRVARLGSVSALLNSGLGLYLTVHLNDRHLVMLRSAQDAVGYAWLALFLTISFLAGLVWGATVQWLAWRTSRE